MLWFFQIDVIMESQRNKNINLHLEFNIKNASKTIDLILKNHVLSNSNHYSIKRYEFLSINQYQYTIFKSQQFTRKINWKTTWFPPIGKHFVFHIFTTLLFAFIWRVKWQWNTIDINIKFNISYQQLNETLPTHSIIRLTKWKLWLQNRDSRN